MPDLARELRKFKNELLMPAIAQINEVTEIFIEPFEHGNKLEQRTLQFRVFRKTKEIERVPDAADVTLVLRAAKMGVRESDLDALTLKYGALKVTEGLDAMEAQINDTSENKILNRGAYLKAVLTNRFPDGGVPEPLSGLGVHLNAGGIGLALGGRRKGGGDNHRCRVGRTLRHRGAWRLRGCRSSSSA